MDTTYIQLDCFECGALNLNPARPRFVYLEGKGNWHFAKRHELDDVEHIDEVYFCKECLEKFRI